MELLNKFLRSHKVLKIDKEFVKEGDNGYWTFCVSYLMQTPTSSNADRREKKDYRLLLSEEHFAIFSKLRTIRKQLAEKDAVPAYAVFTDAELAEIAQLDQLEEKKLLSVDGIGVKRMEKYGNLLLQLYNEHL